MKATTRRPRTPTAASLITEPEALLAALASAERPRATPPPPPPPVLEAPQARIEGWDDERPEPARAAQVVRVRERWPSPFAHPPEVVVIRRRRAA